MKKWIQTLSNKDRESFLEFCKKAYLFSRFLGFQGTVVECNEWSTKEFKKRNFNVVLESEIDNMQIDINKLRDAIDMGIVKQDMGAARIAMLQKELRGAIKQIEDKKKHQWEFGQKFFRKNLKQKYAKLHSWQVQVFIASTDVQLGQLQNNK